MSDLPSGTVTFLMTDIEGSTRLWEQHPHEMAAAVVRNEELAAGAVRAHGGTVVKARGEGDSLFVAFQLASDAIAAALDLQRAYIAEAWPPDTPLRVRAVLHSGEVEPRDGDYFGPVVNRCARLRSIGHGGQVLVSGAVVQFAAPPLPERAQLKDLGSHRLRDLMEPVRVWQLLHPDLPADFPPLRSMAAFATNLPAQLTTFIGRDREMAEIHHLLSVTRLLTLTGSGGCGKTRLALQVAADLLDEYRDGIWLCRLEALTDPALVAKTVASAIGLREESGRLALDSLADYLESRHVLLLLDNCEHLLDTCAELADRLLRTCPNLRILASSREGLGIQGETTYHVPSLSTPDRDRPALAHELNRYESVRLFVDRAAAVSPGFVLGAGNTPAVAQLCRRLDGIPLALELAAARVRALSVEQIAARLDDRFHLLTGGSRVALPRQQTLRALIDWSYNLLSTQERALLCRLSVFAGGWTLEAAEAVCSDPIGDCGTARNAVGLQQESPDTSAGSAVLYTWDVCDCLCSLVEKSLVIFEERAGAGRYRLLESVRQYAREKLADHADGRVVRDRHADYYAELAESADRELREHDEVAVLERLEADHDNLRTALRWAAGREGYLRIAGSLARFWDMHAHLAEGRTWLDPAVIESCTGSAAVLAKAWTGAGTMAWLQADYALAEELHNRALALYREVGDDHGAAFSLNNIGAQAISQGDYARAMPVLEQALRLAREIRDGWLAASIVMNLAVGASEAWDCETAKRYFEEGLSLADQLENREARALLLCNYGSFAADMGDNSHAEKLWDESLRLLEERHEKRRIAYTRCGMSRMACRSGNYASCASHLAEALRICAEIDCRREGAEAMEACAMLASARGRPELAASLLGAADSARRQAGFPVSPQDRLSFYDRLLAETRAALGEAAFATAWQSGSTMKWSDAIALGASHTGPAAVSA